MAISSWAAAGLRGEARHHGAGHLERGRELTAEQADLCGGPRRDGLAEAGRDDDHRTGVAGIEDRARLVLRRGAADVRHAGRGDGTERLIGQVRGRGATIEVHDHEVRVERLEVVRDEDREREREAEGRDDREQQGGSIPDPLTQDATPDDERRAEGAAHRSVSEGLAREVQEDRLEIGLDDLDRADRCAGTRRGLEQRREDRGGLGNDHLQPALARS